MSQEELVPLLQKKDEHAFVLLYDRYAKNLYGIIYSNIGDHKDSESVLQETFLKIWNSIDSFDPAKGRLFTWMLQIARQSAGEWLAANKHRSSAANGHSDNFVHLLEQDKLYNSIDSIGTQEFIRKLKPKCVRLIDLLLFKSYTPEKAGDELELPVGLIKTQNRNCIGDLRNLLKV